ncbi:MAG: DUF669 domain-containing protein [Planctomycetes bacterium]|nr:DUF669 domain-containing protein [Planctomycetota bacterium]MCC7395784.1 hypothetical protein [Planctomycetota bacterium]
MEIDFDASDPVSDFVTVPAGTYVCRVAEIRPGTTRAGDQRWSLRLVVAEGHHVGKQAAWDSLVFSTRGRARARLVLQALGLPASGRVEIEPGDLEGRTALVEIRPAEYKSPSGEVVRRNEVPYDGFRSMPTHGEANGDPSFASARANRREADAIDPGSIPF